jgi:hypothetical protein
MFNFEILKSPRERATRQVHRTASPTARADQ